MLFLKYPDALENDKATEAAIDGKKYAGIIDKTFRWEAWAAPKGKDGQIGHIDGLRLSHLYEAKIKNMGNAGRNGGEYYTSTRSTAPAEPVYVSEVSSPVANNPPVNVAASVSQSAAPVKHKNSTQELARPIRRALRERSVIAGPVPSLI